MPREKKGTLDVHTHTLTASPLLRVVTKTQSSFDTASIPPKPTNIRHVPADDPCRTWLPNRPARTWRTPALRYRSSLDNRGQSVSPSRNIEPLFRVIEATLCLPSLFSRLCAVLFRHRSNDDFIGFFECSTNIDIVAHRTRTACSPQCHGEGERSLFPAQC